MRVKSERQMNQIFGSNSQGTLLPPPPCTTPGGGISVREGEGGMSKGVAHQWHIRG